MVNIWESANWPLAQRASGLKIKDVHTQNVLTYRFFLNLPRRKVMIYFRQKGKKKGHCACFQDHEVHFKKNASL